MFVFRLCSPVVKSISLNSETRVFLSLAVGALFLKKSVLRTLRLCFVLPFCGCSLIDEVGDEDFEACDLFFLTVGALFFIRTMLLAPEANSVFPFLWVLSFV